MPTAESIQRACRERIEFDVTCPSPTDLADVDQGRQALCELIEQAADLLVRRRPVVGSGDRP